MPEDRLFDASSVVEILVGDSGVSVEMLFGEHLLDVTIYEAGNWASRGTNSPTKLSTLPWQFSQTYGRN